MSPGTHHPSPLLIACGAFGARLSAMTVVGAVARGIQEGGLPEPDLCPLAPVDADGEHIRRLLEELDFDARMRRAHAVVVGAARLHEQTLAGSVTFEIATRARQGGVPAYAIARESTLDAFDARILDLQLILRAGSRAALEAAGSELAALV